MTESWRDLYPFASHFLPLEAARLHYVDEGQGLPVLMVHGNPTWSFYWRNLILALRQEYRAIAPDHIGCGLSDKPPLYAYQLGRRIEDLLELIEALDLRRLTLVAHDWGGAIGLAAALRVPKRIARIVLLNTGAFPPPRVPWRIIACRIPWLGTWMIRRWNAFARAALWMAVEHPRFLSPAVQAGLLAPYDSWEHRVAIDKFVKDIPMTRQHPTWRLLQTIEAGLPFLASRPTRLIWGMRDWCFTPACLSRLRKGFPRAEVSEIADAGHYVMEEAAERVIREIRDFLRRTDPLVASN